MNLKEMKKESYWIVQGVDAISDKIVGKLEKYGVGKKDIIRIRLTIEEQLLKVSEHYEGETTVTLRMGKRFATPFFL